MERMKRDRVLVLTTHFMNEAEMLGDHIIVMSKGYLRVSEGGGVHSSGDDVISFACVDQAEGSALELKMQAGIGYLLSVTVPWLRDANATVSDRRGNDSMCVWLCPVCASHVLVRGRLSAG